MDTGCGAAFETGDVITATVAAQSGLPLVPYATDGTNGAQSPRAVLAYEVVVTAGGSVAADALVKGIVDSTRLIIDADGDGTNVDSNVLDLLAQTGITALPVTQTSTLDNGAS